MSVDLQLAQAIVDANQDLREWLRRQQGAWYGGRNPPVRVVEGAKVPAMAGLPGHYQTKSGLRIRHPGAYAKKGMGNMVYVPTTQRIEVGIEWLARKRPKTFGCCLGPLTTRRDRKV